MIRSRLTFYDNFSLVLTMEDNEKSSVTPSQELTFVHSTSSNAPSDPAIRSLIKKHVMRDIGLVRRKERGRVRKKALTFPLAFRPHESETSRKGNTHPSEQVYSTSLLATSDALSQSITVPRSPSASVPNPFQSFPIAMNSRKHELVATGMFAYWCIKAVWTSFTN
jgi:hypothetical protein